MQAALLSSKNLNWRTPQSFLNYVRIMGPIVLDPCTDADNPVGAQHIYTPAEDGLKQSWSAFTDPGTGTRLAFCNPQYGREVTKWMAKASAEAAKEAEIIALVPARTDTKWFHDYVLGTATAVCLLKGRLTFEGAPHPAPFPSAVPYWGPRRASFRAAFYSIGKVIYLQ